jgi:catalase
MAMLITDASGNQWRMAMNHGAFLAVHEPEGVRAQAQAFTPDPATGAPDPVKVAAFLKAYPEAVKFMERMKRAPVPNSWATTEYNGMHAFKLVTADGTSRYVRWRMRPHARFVPWTAEQRKQADQDVLSQDMVRRVREGPLKWDMVLTLASPGDPIDDPSTPWPASDRQLVAGTLTLTQVIPNAQGPCRDVNFDPTVLPPGIEISRDPILAARSGAYAHSFNRRERDIGFGRATEAVGKPTNSEIAR